MIIAVLYGFCEASEGFSKARGVFANRLKGKVQDVSKDHRFWPPGTKESRCKYGGIV